jgi:type I restriction enzyme S subunit
LPIPPIEIQRQVVEELEDTQRRLMSLRELNTHTAAELDALLPSVLDRAFRGEL